jgi:hypothetical protein
LDTTENDLNDAYADFAKLNGHQIKLVGQIKEPLKQCLQKIYMQQHKWTEAKVALLFNYWRW